MSKPILQELYEASIGHHGVTEQPLWNAQAGRWIVFHPATVTTVLRSDCFAVVRHHEEIETLQHERGISLMAAVQSSSLMPLSHDGPRHRELKRHASQVIHSLTDRALEEFSRYSSERLNHLLDCRDQFDIVEEFVLPISARLFSSMTGIDEREFLSQVSSGHCASQLLTSAKSSLSASRWKAINHRMSARQNLVSGGPFEKVMLGSFSLITFEIFRAAMANAIIKLFRAHSGMRISDMILPSQMPSTSIPFVDRVCEADTDLSGKTIRRGDKVLLYMGGCSDDSAEQRKLFFGTGPHICIGKAVTEAAWSALVSILRRRSEFVRLGTVEYRDFDVVLISPNRAELEVWQ